MFLFSLQLSKESGILTKLFFAFQTRAYGAFSLCSRKPTKISYSYIVIQSLKTYQKTRPAKPLTTQTAQFRWQHSQSTEAQAIHKPC